MKTFLIVIGLISLIIISFIVIEYIVGRLPEDHRLVKWWRDHVVGVSDDDLF
jgi:hypothetical protein